MIKIYSTLIILILLSGCSFKTPQNEWQYKSAIAFSSYKKNFLSDNDVLAKSDLNRAIHHAKQSANLTQLARIYLSECSLNISNGIKDECEKYNEIKELSNNKELDAYYTFITDSISQNEIELLPSTYQEFAQNLSKKNYDQANINILTMDKTSSSLLAGTLLKENIQTQTIEYLIQISSYNGYKKTGLFWLKESLKYTKDQDKAILLKKKISILNSEL